MSKKAQDEKPKEKSLYNQIKDGEIEPKGEQKGWLNLEKRTPLNQLDAERRAEICRKGAAAVNRLHGEKKTAKQALENVLSLKITDEIAENADVDPAIIERLKRDNPNATLYDLIQAVAIGRAVGGNVKAMEYVRDTHGDAPVKQVEITENVTTDADRALMRSIAERLESAESVQIVETITQDNVKADG